MILTPAEGSSGFYMVDRKGRVHTAHSFQIDSNGSFGPKPGERPEIGKYSQFAYSTKFWFPTTNVEDLNRGQIEVLELRQEEINEAMIDSFIEEFLS